MVEGPPAFVASGMPVGVSTIEGKRGRLAAWTRQGPRTAAQCKDKSARVGPSGGRPAPPGRGVSLPRGPSGTLAPRGNASAGRELEDHPEEVATADAQSIAEELMEWFSHEGRDLPWRRPPRTPYRVLVSELMLQQTRADVVARRFEAFVDRYPDFAALAQATLDDVLRAWEGLGYYRRAQALWRTARVVAARGELPVEREELLRLPGIGPYSASAVRSFAFSLPDPALDANLRRVALRVMGERADPARAQAQKAAHGLLSEVLKAGPPADLSDALMDLGALVCTSRGPRCEICPIARWCAGRESGEPEAFGRPAAKGARRELRIVALRVESELGLLWRPRPSKGLLAGLWEPPHLLAPEQPGEGEIDRLLATWGVRGARDTGERWPMSHVFTHQAWIGEVRRIEAESLPPSAPARWLNRHALAEVALPSAFRAVLSKGW